MRVGYFLGAMPPRFARVRRAGWDRKRREVMEDTVKGAVGLSLGLRRTKFRPRVEGAMRPEKVGEEFYGVSRLGSWREGFRMWGALYGEMAVVVGVASVIGVVLAPITVPAPGLWLVFGS